MAIRGWLTAKRRGAPPRRIIRFARASPLAIALVSGCAPDLAAQGQAALVRGDDGEAVRLLRRAVDADPDDATAWRELARAHLRRGEPAAGRVAIDRATALRPDDPQVVLLRGQIRMNQGDREGAREDARRALELGRTAPLLEQVAVLLVRLGEAELALRAASRAVERSGGAAAAYGNLAVLAVELRRFDTAEHALREGRARHPHDVALAQTHAAFLLATDRPAEARTVYRDLLPRHPEPGLVHHALALLAHEAGDLDDAQRHADAAALALGSTRPDVLYTRIVILHARGQTAQAQAELRKALRRFPAHRDLITLRDRL